MATPQKRRPPTFAEILQKIAHLEDATAAERDATAGRKKVQRELIEMFAGLDQEQPGMSGAEVQDAQAKAGAIVDRLKGLAAEPPQS